MKIRYSVMAISANGKKRGGMSMDVKQMELVLYNLSELEIAFKESSSHNNDYNDMNTYTKFLNQFFIVKHNLQSVYWPQPGFTKYRSLTSYTELKEDWLFLSGNITLMKQLNLPFDHMLVNDFFQCIYVMEGSAHLVVENEKKELESGDFFVLFPGTAHLINTPDNAIVINILVKQNHLYSEKFNILNSWPSPDFPELDAGYRPRKLSYILFHTIQNPEIRSTILQMFIEYLQNSDYKELVMDSLLTLLLAYLMRYQKDTREFSSRLTGSQKAFSQIWQYCCTNIDCATLEQAADRLHYSKQYICRITKDITGDTFSHLITRMKIEKAKKYLKGSNLTLDSIAALTGFSDAAHLSRTFKKYENTTPSEFRKMKYETDSPSIRSRRQKLPPPG